MNNLSVITNDNIQSYNRAVNAINQNQRNNIRKLNKALSNANSAINNIQLAYANLSSTINELKKKVFINQALCDNFDKCLILTCGAGEASDYGYGLGIISPLSFRKDILK